MRRATGNGLCIAVSTCEWRWRRLQASHGRVCTAPTSRPPPASRASSGFCCTPLWRFTNEEVPVSRNSGTPSVSAMALWGPRPCPLPSRTCWQCSGGSLEPLAGSLSSLFLQPFPAALSPSQMHTRPLKPCAIQHAQSGACARRRPAQHAHSAGRWAPPPPSHGSDHRCLSGAAQRCQTDTVRCTQHVPRPAAPLRRKPSGANSASAAHSRRCPYCCRTQGAELDSKAVALSHEARPSAQLLLSAAASDHAAPRPPHRRTPPRRHATNSRPRPAACGVSPYSAR